MATGIDNVKNFPQLARMKAKLLHGQSADKFFDVDEYVNLVTVPAGQPQYQPPVVLAGSAFWRAIAVEFVDAIFPEEHEFGPDAEEEPSFVAYSLIDSLRVLFPIPPGEPKEVDQMDTMPFTNVLAGSIGNLDDQRNHRLTVNASAFDGGEAGFQRLADAFANDIQGYVQGGISLVPGPHGTLDQIWKLVREAIVGLFRRDQIGGHEYVLDERWHVWGRPATMTEWTGLKFLAFFKENQNLNEQLWYLTLWRITLTTRPVDFSLQPTSESGG